MTTGTPECCASGSCEVCRQPVGYSRERREQIAREQRDYEPPWVREHRREGWGVLGDYRNPNRGHAGR